MFELFLCYFEEMETFYEAKKSVCVVTQVLEFKRMKLVIRQSILRLLRDSLLYHVHTDFMMCIILSIFP